MLRASRPVQLGVGAFMLAIPASAVALTASQADTQSVIQINLDRHQLGFGRNVKVSGTVTPSKPGQTLELEYAPAGSTSWQAVAKAKVRPDGRFRFASPLRKSGLVRVGGDGAVSSARLNPQAAKDPASGSAQSTTTPPSAISASPSQRVTVAARFQVPNRATQLLGANNVHVRGVLLPRVGGRLVRLLARSGNGWHTLATARTSPRGGFDLHAAGGPGEETLRVKFAGDRLNSHAWAGAGRVTSYRQSLASWYDDGGSTACGFHAHFGVANKSLPCGTQVTFNYGGRSVTATVDDRGPYVGGREWDLNQNVAGALGFDGVGAVWSTI
jgi:rare lipoprotein A